jgi:hypothetical protein
MRQYFEISEDLKYLDEVNDRTTARQFIRQLLFPPPPTNDLTRQQEYLKGLVELSGPALEAQRAARRLRSARPRPRTSRAATAGALIMIQSENENAIANGSLNFARKAQGG